MLGWRGMVDWEHIAPRTTCMRYAAGTIAYADDAYLCSWSWVCRSAHEFRYEFVISNIICGNGLTEDVMALNTMGFTKVIVADIPASEEFYTRTLGLIVDQRIAFGEGHDAMEEAILYAPGASTALGAGHLILARYPNRPTPAPGEAILGFVVRDAEATVEAAMSAGGQVVQPVYAPPGSGVRFAIFKDPEGHVVQIVEKLA